MRRLIAFGDSFTKYRWPTWPNIIGQNFDITLNYGQPGCGNFVIFYRVMQAVMDKNIGVDDTVIVQWTDPARIDFLDNNGGWPMLGDTSAERLVMAGLDYYNSDQLTTVKQLTYMVAVAKLLEETGCKWYYAFLNKFSMVHLDSHNEEFNVHYQNTMITPEYDLLKRTMQQYKDHLIDKNFNDYIKETYGHNAWKYTCSYYHEGKHIEFLDTHPSPMQFLFWIKDHAMRTIDGLSMDVMARYADHAENYLNSVCPGGKYTPMGTHAAFDDFERQNGYKDVTKSYHV